MAFDDLTPRQKELMNKVLELLSTGNYGVDIHAFVPDHGDPTLLLKGRGCEKSLREFGETDLISLEQLGYITLIRKARYDPCASRRPQYIAGLTPKAYQEYDLQGSAKDKPPSPPPNLPSSLEQLLMVLRGDWINSVVGYYLNHRPNLPYARLDDEYKVQDLMYCLLVSRIPDIQFENPQSKNIGAVTSTRVDFSSAQACLFFEAKLATNRHDAKEIERELSEDIVKYGRQGVFRALIFFVYCYDYTFPNPREFERGLTGENVIDKHEFQTYCIVKP